jgi:hypothetical protein
MALGGGLVSPIKPAFFYAINLTQKKQALIFFKKG